MMRKGLTRTMRNSFLRTPRALLILSVCSSPFSFWTTAQAAVDQSTTPTQIIRSYMSVRSAGMGGVRYTTGLYEENFFANPARITSNPRSKFTLLDLSLETNASTLGSIGSLSSLSDSNRIFSNSSLTDLGDNKHLRTQLTFPAYYRLFGEEDRFALAAGLFVSSQVDLMLSSTYELTPLSIVDLGPSLAFGMKLLKDRSLSVGINTRFAYRLATDQVITLAELLQSNSLSIESIGGQGAMVDFDLGATYRLPLGLQSPFRYHLGFAVNQVMNGKFDLIPLQIIPSVNRAPYTQPRTWNWGASVTRELWGSFERSSLAFEVTDLGNNSGGSAFRLFHLGAETHWKALAFRLGLNQGYFAAGLGLNTRFFALDLATYGEELSLNVGKTEDRRFALRFTFQIQGKESKAKSEPRDSSESGAKPTPVISPTEAPPPPPITPTPTQSPVLAPEPVQAPPAPSPKVSPSSESAPQAKSKAKSLQRRSSAKR